MAWWLILIQGILALIIGLFMLLVRETGFETQMIGLFILIEGAFTVYRVFKDWRIDQDEVYRLMRSMVGITTGLITFVTPLMVYVAFQLTALRVLATAMAIGLTLEGLVGLWAIFQTDDLRTRLVNTLIAITFVGMGVVYFVQVITFTNLIPWIGLIMSFIGAGLIAYAFFVRSRHAIAADETQQEIPEDVSVA